MVWSCGSIHPSIHPFVTIFLRIHSLGFFSEILYSNRNLVKRISCWCGFPRKAFWPEPQNVEKTSFFYNFWKALSLLFSGGNLKLKAVQFFVFLCKPNIWEDSVSRLICQMQGCPTRLKDSLIINIHGRNQFIS